MNDDDLREMSLCELAFEYRNTAPLNGLGNELLERIAAELRRRDAELVSLRGAVELAARSRAAGTSATPDPNYYTAERLREMDQWSLPALARSLVYRVANLVGKPCPDDAEFRPHLLRFGDRQLELDRLRAGASPPRTVEAALRPESALPSPQEPTGANAVQHGGAHYKSQTIQVWDFVAKNGIGYLEGNAIKYLSRWKAKGGLEDIRKALHYVQKLIEVEEAKGDS